MYFYEVLIASQSYHADKPLTYSWEKILHAGAIVAVPLRDKTVLGMVTESTPKPRFKSKPIIRQIAEGTVMPSQHLQLIKWLTDYYPAPFGQILSLFLPNTLLTKEKPEAQAARSSKTKPLPTLTSEQRQALDIILDNYPKNVLVHGETGSGKTRLYIDAAKHSIQNERSVIILCPEIGLTAQLAQAFRDAFGDRVIVMHSELTPTERRSNWLQSLRSKQPVIIIGPRSALFMPVHNLGLIVIDESHESSYKQEQSPHYQASRVAAKLAELHSAQLILGSATPLVSDYYAFTAKNLPIARLNRIANSTTRKPARIKVINIKEKSNFTRSSHMSDELINSISKTIQNGKQSLIFLNRRGTARLVLCQKCDWQALCPNCDLPLTYHGDQHIMRCHICNYNSKTPLNCPVCSSNDIIFRTIGTKSIVNELKKLFPQAKIQRFDSDNAKAESLERQYDSIRNGDMDILVGTQILGKGLDLPRLALVGIIAAETSLSFPDYTAEERTYQLITQALGRINRGHTAGTAIVQSLRPDSPVLAASIEKNYAKFYKRAIEERKSYGLPPFKFILKIIATRKTDLAAKKASQTIARQIHSQNLPVELSGPSPAFIEKSHGNYRWQIIVKSSGRQNLTNIIKKLPANCNYDIDPTNLL